MEDWSIWGLTLRVFFVHKSKAALQEWYTGSPNTITHGCQFNLLSSTSLGSREFIPTACVFTLLDCIKLDEAYIGTKKGASQEHLVWVDHSSRGGMRLSSQEYGMKRSSA